MGVLKYGVLYNIRKPISSLIMILVMVLIIFGELVGLCLYSAASQGEEQAFIYNGYALSLDDVALNPEMVKSIENISHVTDVERWSFYDVNPIDLKSVKVYEGDKVENVDEYSNEMCLIAHMNTQLDSWFRYEKAVSLSVGEFPSATNKGVLVEKRFAEANNITIDNKISIEVKGIKCVFTICGIYEVETEFIIKDINELGETTFSYSPYNRMYVNYENLAQQLGEDAYSNGSWNVYTESYDSVNSVIKDLRKLLGSEVSIYNNADTYLESSSAVIVVMKNFSKIILIYTSIIGGIIIVIIITFFATQYRHEIGIFLSLGYKKSKIIVMYLCNMLIMLLVAVLISSVLYCMTADAIVKVVDNNVIETFERTLNIGSSPIETPELEKGFSLVINAFNIFGIENAIRIVCIILGFLVLSAGLPVVIVLNTKPRILLEE